jgi:hypothetical protein
VAKPTGRRWTLLLTALATLLISVPTAVWAAHQFTDVPNSHTFHNAIDWMRTNNITVGCNPPANTQYCPDDNVTRGQMAAFMKRLAENQVVDAASLSGFVATDLVPGSKPPSGTTIRGAFIMGGNAQGAFAISLTDISFGYDLGEAPTPHFIHFDGIPPAECPGNHASPQAAPGHLCIYEFTATNTAARNLRGPGGGATSYSFGTGLFVSSAGAGSYDSAGSWAVTAP